MANAYDTLQNTVTETSASLKKAQEDLRKLQTDPYFTNMAGILAATGPNEWISNDGAGTKWGGADARQTHSTVQLGVDDWNRRIAAQNGIVNDLTNQLDKAQKSLANYEANSPVATVTQKTSALLATVKAADKSKLIMIGGAILIGITIIIGIVIYFRNKNKTKAQ